MPGRVVFFLQHATYEPAYQAASLAITAAAMGDQVYVVLSFDALQQLLQGTFGQPHSEKEQLESARAEGLGLPAPQKMLEESRSLGAQIVACDTTLRICGLSSSEVEGKLDQVVGLVSIWRLTEGARVVAI
jgi:peroxiredoxin family protein